MKQNISQRQEMLNNILLIVEETKALLEVNRTSQVYQLGVEKMEEVDPKLRELFENISKTSLHATLELEKYINEKLLD
jgi:hypothetical protein